MNILHTETLKRWGGQQNRVLSESIGLKQRGYGVVIACNSGSVLAERSKEAGIKVYELNMVKHAHPVNIPKLIRIISNERIDIVSTHSSVDSWAGGFAAKLSGRHLVRFRHNLFPVSKDPLSRLIYALPEKIIAISDAVKKVLTERGIRQEKITVIPSSVNIDFFNPESEDLKEDLGISADTLVIGNTSTFTWTKGQEVLLKAFNNIYKKFPCKLLFAGALPESKKSKYLNHVNEEIRDNVILLGHREDIQRVLKTIDIFIYPSLLEGLGTALLEAMAMKRAVVVSDISTFKYFIKDRESGIFFRSESSSDLAEKVLDLLSDKDLRKQLGSNARREILRNFTFDKMINQTETQYKSILCN